MRQRAISGRVGAGASGPSEVKTPVPRGTSPVFGTNEGNGANVALLTEPEVADRLRVSLACLRRWRLERRGPRFLKLGSLVRYPAEELNSWIESLPTGGATPAPVPTSRQARAAS